MSVRFKDYYEILGVERGASDADIKRAYRDLARKYHPDVSKAADAAERFKEINEAYEVLKDPEKRKRYDQLGPGYHDGQEFRPPPGYEGFGGFEDLGGFGGADASGFSDFFEALFGQGGGFGGPRAGFAGQRAGPRPRRGVDHEAELELTLEEVRRGGSKTVTLRDEAGGERTYTVKLPPGTTDGSRIRLGGQGGSGRGEGAPAGDLLLRVRLAPHPRFEVDGVEVRTTVDVAPWEAALGAAVTVPTLSGKVELKIPPGTPSGRSLRLRGLGLPRGGDAYGDLFVRVRIVVPSELTDAERRLFEELAAKSPFRPRGDLDDEQS